MKTRLVAILICLSIFNLAYSQKGFKNNGAKVIVNSGGIINITGGTSADFINATSGSNHGRIDLDGKIKLEGDWANNATSGSVFINVDTDGEVQFKGTNVHAVSGNQTGFEKLTLNTTGNVTLSTSASANGNLTLTNGLLVLGANNLTLGASSAISGTPTASNMVVANSTGELRKTFTGAGSFTYPIGDNTSTVEYSPITLNFASGTFGGSAYAGARVTNAKHPNNTSTTGYINRYWSLSQNNISAFSCDLTATYTNADVFGTETSLFSGYYSTPYWVKLAAVNAGANQLTGTVSAFNPITAGDQAMFCTSTITIAESITNVACYGNNTGAINVTVSGGYGAYTYNWSGTGVVASQEDQTGLSAGTYNLTVTDQNGCTQTDVFTITQPSAALSLSTTQTNISCYGNSTGAIDLTVTGGTPSYIYSWSNSATSQDLNSVIAGPYSVTVTDGNGCQSNISATLTQPAAALSIASTQTNVSCFSGNNGAIDITVSGGTVGTGYVYNWNGGISTEDRTNLIAGTYTVTVTDANSCIAQKSVTITQPAAALSVAITSQTNVSCFGGSDGAINITATGGTTAYTYDWGGGITSEDRTSLLAGAYVVTVTDSKGCTASIATTVTQPAAALAVVVTSQTNILCNGNSTGAINITASGGTPSYIYNWGAVTTEDRVNIAAGTYSVTVTDSKSCTASVSTTITEPAALAIVTTGNDATCYGNSDGSASVAASGGTTPYLYTWDDPAFQTTATASNLVANTYNVTVTDNNGCTKLGSAIVSQPTLIVLTTSSTQASCGISDGSATVSATGGAGNYSYDWSPDGYTNDFTPTYSDIPAGTYTVTVADIDGCFVTENINVSESGAPTASITASTNVSCFGGNNGQATVTASGGTPGYTYLWTGGQATATATNLTAGTYNVTVKDNNGSGCSATASVTITQPTVLNASITASSNVSCFGGNNGTATVTASGGSTPYSYNWTGGLSTSTINNLTAGTYDVTVTDIKSCTKTTSVVISQPVAALSYSVNTIQNVNCFGGNDGSVDISATGGTSPYTYLWSTGSTNQDLNTLIAGDYLFTVTDANGCSLSNVAGTIVVSEPSAALNATATGVDVNCFNGTDGSINLTVTGGTTAYSFLWSNNSTTEDLSNIGAGTYSVTVTDLNNCEATTSVAINQPIESLTASVSITDVKCYGDLTGAIDLTVSGGTSPYSYLWSNSAITEDLASLAANSYLVTVTDNNGCKAYATGIITQPSAALSITEVLSNVLCNGGNSGSIDVSVSGGTMPYSYVWSNSTSNQDLYSLTAGNYTLTVTDVNNCQANSSYSITEPTQLNLTLSGTDVKCFGGTDGSVSASVTGGTSSYSYLWNNSVTTQNQANIYAGIHTVTVTDGNGCTISNNFTVNQPDELLASSLVSNVSCFNAGDGSIDLTVTGGTTAYSFAWDNLATTEDLTGLNLGNYSYTITDANGCEYAGSESITEPDEIILDVLSFNASCGLSNGEAIVSVVSGGISPFNYLWSDNSTTASISSLSNGDYFVTVTDATGCQATGSATIGITYPPTVSISNSTDASCFASCNGNATIQISGGQTPYSIMWSDPSSQTTATANGLCEGIYDVTVTDGNNCSASTSVTISQPTAIVVTSSSTPTTCFGVCDGTASLVVSGGVSSYTYLWNDLNGQTTNVASNLCAGNYNYSVTDANSCIKTGSILVSTPAELTASIVSTDVTCNAGNDGNADLTVSGGITPYSFTWSNTLTTEDISNLVADTYFVTVVDNNLCSTVSSVTINEPILLVPTISGNLSYCSGANTTLDVGSYSSYLWSNNEITQTIVVTSGTYSVTVVDANGCTGESTSVDVIENALPTPSITGTLSYCAGLNTTLDAGSFDTYLWSTNETTQTINATVGTYTVTVTDANGCTGVSISVDVIENSLPTPSITGVLSYCEGSNTTLDAGSYSSYLWSTNETSQSVSVTAGNYDVTVVDANGCSASASAIVVENALPSPVISGSLTYCTGFSSTLDAGSYTSYVWSESSTTQTISATTANNPISVTVTDSNGCVGVSPEVNVSESTTLSPVITGNLSYCAGDNTTLDAGIYPNYIWSTNETTQTISVTAGNYDVTVSDANGCSGTASVTVTENALPTPSITGDLSYCEGSFTSLDAGIFASYNWSSGEFSEVVDVTAGAYVVSVTDDNGCVGVSSEVIVTENPSPIVSITGALSYCEGSNTTLDAGSYSSYLWSNNEITQTITVTSGSYEVIVTDANGCTGSANVFVTENALPTPSINGNLSYCAGSSTTLDAGVYSSYAWSSGEFTQTISATAGSFTVTVTDTNACIGVASVVVSENALPTPSITGDLSYCEGSNTTLDAGSYSTYLWSSGETVQIITATSGTYSVTVTDIIGCQGSSSSVDVIENLLPTVSITGYNVSCNSDANGSADLTILTGTSPFSYLWSNGEITEDVTGLVANSYNVTVTDANGCNNIASVTISEPDALMMSFVVVPEDAGADGSIDITVTGGTTPYTFVWSNSASSEDLTGLVAGFYNVTVTDANGCSITHNFTINNISCTLVTSIANSNISCFGLVDGSIDLTTSGGTTPYVFNWSNSETTEDLSGLDVGFYQVTVTDNNGCTSIESANITSPAELLVSIIGTDVSCNGGTNGVANLTVTGGTSPFSFTWSNSEITEDLYDLSAGVYDVTVIDNNLCQNTSSVTITEPLELIASSLTTDLVCFGSNIGSVDLTVTGGTTPYVFAWSNLETTEDLSGLSAGNYIVTVTDNAGCNVVESVTISSPTELMVSDLSSNITCNGANDGSIDLTVTGGTTPYVFAWSNSETTEDLSNLSASTYDVTITDNNMCQVFSSITIDEPLVISISAVSSDLTCNGNSDGVVDLTVTGGTTPYTFAWDNLETTEDLSGLSAGDYTVVVTDANGCIDGGTYTVTEPTAITISSVVVPETSNDGSIDVTVTGGTTPYTFAWDNSATTEDLTGLSAGIYNLTVTDSNGCSSSDQFVINNVSCTLAGSITGTDVSCFGLSDGFVDLTVTGGTTPYVFAWSNLETTEDLSNLLASTYDVTITDASSCVDIVSVTINQPDAISLVLSSTDDFGTGDGTATVIVTGGTSPYTYLWDDGLNQTSATAVNLANNLYNVTVTDFNGCTATDTITVKLYVGIDIVNSYLTATVYPNPAKDLLNIMISSSQIEDVEFIIYDAIGQVVYINKVVTENGNKLFNVDLSNKADGIYFIKFNNSVNNQLIRFVKSGN